MERVEWRKCLRIFSIALLVYWKETNNIPEENFQWPAPVLNNAVKYFKSVRIPVKKIRSQNMLYMIVFCPCYGDLKYSGLLTCFNFKMLHWAYPHYLPSIIMKFIYFGQNVEVINMPKWLYRKNIIQRILSTSSARDISREFLLLLLWTSTFNKLYWSCAGLNVEKKLCSFCLKLN